MKTLSKEELAELIIYSESIHNILLQHEKDFNHQLKFEFNKISKSTKNIIKLAFGKKDLGELDEIAATTRKFTNKMINNKIYLLDDK